MGKSLGRDQYLRKIRQETATAHELVAALERSPYSQHRKVAKPLKAELEKMSAAAIEQLIKQKESEEFKKSLGL